MAGNFADILNRSTDTIEKPKPLPGGEYLLIINKYSLGESQQKKTPYVRIEFSIGAPGADVDQSLLQGIDLSKKGQKDDFYLTEDSLYRVVEFMTRDLGINGTGRTLSQMLPEVVGKQVIASIKQVPSQKPGDDRVFNEIEGYRNVNTPKAA